MIFRNTILTALLGLSAARDTQKSTYLRNLQQDKKMKKPCTLFLRIGEFENYTETYSWDCELDEDDDSKGKIVSLKGKTFKKDQFESGVSTLFGDVTINSNGQATIKGNPIIGRRNKPKKYAPNSRSLQTTDTRTVLAIRVVGNDVSTTSSETTLADEIFGSNGDIFNLKTGFSRCSYNQLNFIPTTDSRVGGDGVMTVTLNKDIFNSDQNVLRDEVVTAAEAQLGTLRTQFDHVMICLPTLSTNWGIAYAYVNWYLSVYSNQWCNYPSAQMHEIGHNINLAHSGETATYDDQSGMMGFSYSSDEGPAMCFNNAKNWQLGWYSDRRVVVDPLTSSWSGDLVGLAEYSPSSTLAYAVILKVADTNTNLDYYIGFNRSTGINAGTREGGNQVTIQRRSSGNGYAESDLVAKLSAGGTYTIPNFRGSGDDVIIQVQSIDTSSTPGKALVLVYKDGTSAPTKAPVTSAPTKSPTKSPTKAPVTSPPTKAPVTSPPTKSPTKSPTKAPTVGPDCSSFTKSRDCNRTTGCEWSQGSCKATNPTPSPPSPPTSPSPPTNPPSCSSITSSRTCKNTQGCTWNNRSKTCS